MDSSYVMMMHPAQYRDLVMIQDRYGIYAQRKALARAIPGVQVWRGREWWH